jgi:hypothetical protein
MQVVVEYLVVQDKQEFQQEQVVELETFLEAQMQLQVVVASSVVEEVQQVHLLLALVAMVVQAISL